MFYGYTFPYQRWLFLKSNKKEIGWGNQIRSYVLHPYKMVKDLRTNYQTSNAEAFLDGSIFDFLEASLLDD